MTKRLIYISATLWMFFLLSSSFLSGATSNSFKKQSLPTFNSNLPPLSSGDSIPMDSSGWIGTVEYSDTTPPSFYSPQQFIDNDSSWANIPIDEIDARPYWTHFALKDTMCVSENFSIEFRIRTGPPNGLPAYDTEIGVTTDLGTSKAVLMPDSSGQPWTRILVMGDTTVSNTPSLIFPQLYQWTNIKLVFQDDHTASFYLNGSKFASATYSGEICSITSLDVRFKGSGYLDWVEVKDAAQNILYTEDFSAADRMTKVVDRCATIQQNLKVDYNPCKNDTLFLTSNLALIPPDTKYLWTGPNGFSDTVQNPQIVAPSPVDSGWYFCTISTTPCYPKYTDSIYVEIDTTSPPLLDTLITDTICKGTIYTFPDSTTTTKPGSYEIRLLNSVGCDSIVINYRLIQNEIPSVVLPPVFCLGFHEQVDLQPQISDGEILWQDGSTANSLTVSNPGVYWVQATNYCGTARDSIQIDPCSNQIFLPSAFTPNNDGKNDIFKILNAYGHHLISFDIYDQWGQKRFHTTDIAQGWDGHNAPMGSYVYMIRIKTTSGEIKLIKGTVLLIR